MSAAFYTPGELSAIGGSVNAAVAARFTPARSWAVPWQSDTGHLYAVSRAGYACAPLTAHGNTPQALLADIFQVEADAARSRRRTERAA